MTNNDSADQEFVKSIKLNKLVHVQFWNTELEIAVRDLENKNTFSLTECACGPYDVDMKVVDNRLVLDITSESNNAKIVIPSKPFASVIKDYFLVFDSYQEALNKGHHARLQAIDMGRRGLHDEGADILIEVLSGKIKTDHETARRLFTILMVLHLK